MAWQQIWDIKNIEELSNKDMIQNPYDPLIKFELLFSIQSSFDQSRNSKLNKLSII